jgi:hypothetical protein
MNRLPSFNPESFDSEFAFGGAMRLRDSERDRIGKPRGCRHAAAESLSAFEINPGVGPVAPALRRTLRRALPAIPRAPSPQPSFDSQAFRRRAVQIANQELARWGDGRTKETDPRLYKTLQNYWQTGAGRSICDQQLADPAFQNANPWSAAFISWLMKTAGAGAAFNYSRYHSAYIRAAIDDRLANNSNSFKAYRTAEIAPQVGDPVCKSRAESGTTYNNVLPPMKTHCDIVTEVQPGRIVIVGGNVGDSVAQRKLRTDARDRIAEPNYFAVIRVPDDAEPVKRVRPNGDHPYF